MVLLRKIFKWLLVGLASFLIITAIGGRIYQVTSESRDIKALLFVDSSHEQQANRLPQSSDSGNGNDAALRIGK